MYKKILVPLDGSEFAECSLRHAMAIAKGCGTEEVTVLRVLEPLTQVTDIVGVDTEEWYRKARENAKAAIEKYVSSAAAKMKKEGINAKGAVLEGRAGDEILDYAKSKKMDLIVLSTHGRSGVSRWVMGSVADKVLRHSPIPVLIAAPPTCRKA